MQLWLNKMDTKLLRKREVEESEIASAYTGG